MPLSGSTLIPWVVAQNGLDTNGGTSTAVRSSGTDGVTNGTTTFTAASGAFTSGDVGHGIQIGANWRTIASVTNGTTLVLNATVTTASGQTWTIGGPLRTINKIANLSGAPLASGDVIAVTPSILHYREAITLGQSGAAVGGAITNVSAAAPAVITTTSAHGLVVGQYVYIDGVVGASEVNGLHKVAAVTSTTYTIDNTGTPSAYTSGGTTQQLIALVGDVDGAYTGSTGIVRVNAYTNSDFVTAGANAPWVVNGKSNWCFLSVDTIGGAQRCINMTTAGSQYIVFANCAVQGGVGSSNGIDIQATADTAMHLRFINCVAFTMNGSACVSTTAPTTATAADYNLDIVFDNCVLINLANGGAGLSCTSSGASSHKAGGITLRNCSLFAQGQDVVTDTNFSVIYPVVVVNNALGGANLTQGLRSATTGTIQEDYNAIGTTTAYGGLSQPLTGTASPSQNNATSVPLEVEIGYASLTQEEKRPFLSPQIGSRLLGMGRTLMAVGTPGTFADDATVGSSAWTNPSNAGYPDSGYATNAVTNATDSHYIKCTNLAWDRDIPANAVIDGIRLEYHAHASQASQISLSGGSAGAKFIKSGTIGGSNKRDTTTQGTGDAWYVVGGHCDLWGNTLTSADVLASTSGVAIAFHCASSTTTVSLDFVRLVCYFHLPQASDIGSLCSPTQAKDLHRRPRPAGQAQILASGTATSGGTATMTDTGAAWGTNAFALCMVAITSGTGSGQYKVIASNTATVITVQSNWVTNPDSSSKYTIYQPGSAICETGQATSGSATALTVSNAAWKTNQWAGYTLEITSGTGSGQIVPILSNTGTALTIGPETNAQFVTTPDSTSKYSIYRGIGGCSATQAASGAYECHDLAGKWTGSSEADGVGIQLNAPGNQEVQFAVDASQTSIALKLAVDNAANWLGKEPKLVALANNEVGLASDQSLTCSSPAIGTSLGTYTLTFSPQPTASGIVTVRLDASGGPLLGTVYADTFGET